MAIYHLSIKIITRGKGKSAVAAAAYRAGEKIFSERENVMYDYSRKGGIVHTEIFLPENAPGEYEHRSKLWNAVENSERYANAQLSREFEIALPAELSREQNISLMRKFVTEVLVSAGMCADACYHDKGDGNPHAHIMCSMRPIEKDGKWGAKSRTVDGRKINTVDWNDRDKAEQWRKAWADYCNDVLRENGHETAIDHRSYERQGIEQIPTVHMGVAATHMERRGIVTELGDRNREIEISNKQIRYLNARLTRLEKWLGDEKENTGTPSLADVISELLDRPKYSQIYRIKNAAEILAFLQRNKITDAEELDEKVGDMKENLGTMKGELGKLDRRIKTLYEHIGQSTNYKQFRRHKKRFTELRAEYAEVKKATGFGAKRKAEKALKAVNDYRDSHRDELDQFDEADKYLRGVLQSRFDPDKLPPIKKWERELADKLYERDMLNQKFQTLKSETRNVEEIKRSIDRLLSGDTSDSAGAEKTEPRSDMAQKPKPGIFETLDKISQMQKAERQQTSEQPPRKSHDMEL